MDRATFLRSSPREIDELLQALSAREQRRFVPAALICSVIAEVNRDPKEREDPFTMADFLPGAEPRLSKEEELIAWMQQLERIECGEEEEPEFDYEAMENFKRAMKATFKSKDHAKPPGQGEVSAVGPRGKRETI